MRKLIVFGVLLGVAAALVGCGKERERTSGGSSESSSGNPYEKMVQDFCTSAQQFSSALRMCDNRLLSEFNLHDCASALKGTSRRTKSASASDAFWSALIEGKKSVKTEIIKTVDLKDMDVKGAFIAATCGDATIYFGVGSEKGREVKMDVIDKEEMEEKIKEVEKIEKMDGKKRLRLPWRAAGKKVAGATEAISEEEGGKAMNAVKSIDENTIRRLGE